METQLKSDLFRFVTLRAAERNTETTLQNSRMFVSTPDLSESEMYRMVHDLGSVEQAAQSFGAYQSQHDLQGAAPDLYEFAAWLSQNQDSLTPATVQQRIDGLQPLYWQTAIPIWDNLFYQLGANNTAHLTDIITQMITADNFIRVYHDNPGMSAEDLVQLAKAKILIPMEMLGRDGHFLDRVTVTNGNAQTFNGSKYHTEALDALIAKDTAARSEKALTELKKVQALYEKNENTTRERQRQQYEADVAHALKGITSSPPEDLGIPVPDYTPGVEMERSFLQQTLSAGTFYLLDKAGLVGASTFNEAISAVAEKSRTATATQFQKSLAPKAVVVAAGGQLPVKDISPSVSVPYSFSAMAIPVAANTYKIAVVMDTAHDKSGVLSATYNSNGQQVTAIADEPVNDMLGMYFHPEGFTVSAGAPSIPLNAELQLQSGQRLTISADIPVKENPTPVDIKPGVGIVKESGNSSPAVGNTAPSAYGIRRLGIADYRKVEQSVCCYVAGEVSHIENIMAREYKEKSSRRLRRSETTTTTDTETEKESLTDSSTTERNEMQRESAQSIAESTALSLGASANVSYTSPHVSGGVNLTANYSSNMSKQQSDRQAVNFAKDVTMHASERISQKITEQQIIKVIEEFEEQDKHGFDNRGDNAENISGVYRWVDKIYRNQVVNYGSRLMYEFMIPQPANLHRSMLNAIPDQAVTVSMPVNFRAGIPNAGAITRGNYSGWAGMYNVDVQAPPTDTIYTGKSYSYSGFAGNNNGGNELYDTKETCNIPEGYIAVAVSVSISAVNDGSSGQKHCASVTVGNSIFTDSFRYLSNVNNMNNATVYIPGNTSPAYRMIDNYESELPISVSAMNFETFNANVSIKLQLSPGAYEKWQVETFTAINKGYEAKLAEYNQALADAKAKTAATKETNPMYYRLIENTVLRKNCMEYLTGQGYTGKNMMSTSDTTLPKLDANLDSYSSVISFMEQAFEWEIMSYIFYPFYWGDRNNWEMLYNTDNDDPLFRSFMQAGMGRIIVSVRPGFEDAVMYYMSTGKVWNGGAPPLINDPLYTDIVAELNSPGGVVEETWETRVPSSLTVIQKSTIGLNASGLPCNEDCSDNQYFFSSDKKLELLKTP